MQLKAKMVRALAGSLTCLAVTACTFNPFIANNHNTGSGGSTAVGAGIGAGGVWLLGGSKTMALFGGIAGGAVGYYVSSLRYDAGGIIDVGGQVYILGEYIGIYLPTDKVFESNTADLLPGATRVLDSVAAVLQRKPNNNIMVSGNTSGFDRPRREQKLSQKRAKVIAAYLWTAGIQQFKGSTDQSSDTRQFTYVGYGDYFPIASDLTNNGIRANSRIQITSYPSWADLHERNNKIDKNNIASMNDDAAASVRDNRDTCGKDRQNC